METANPTGADTTSLSHAAARLSQPEKKPEKQAPKPKEVKEVKEVEAPIQELDPETEVEVKEPEASDEVKDAREATEQPEETSFERLEQLAEALDMPVEKFLQTIKSKVKVAGQEREVTLQEALNGYQMESDYRQKTMELAETRKAFEAEKEKQLNDVKARLSDAGQVAEFYETQLMGEYNSINWQQLRVENPAEYAALQQDYNQRYQQLQGAKQKIAYEQQRLSYEGQQKQTEAFNKLISEEKQKLASLIPEFQDEAKAKVLQSEMRAFLKSNGFKDEEVNQVYDHRHVLMIRDAMKYRNLQNKNPQITNKVKEAPKLLKPGSKQPVNKLTQQLRDARTKLKKSGSLKDAANSIKHLL